VIADVDLFGVAAVITATGVAVGALLAAFLPYRTTKATHAIVKEIDRAVNGKPAGETTMVQQIQDLTDTAASEPEPDAIVPMLKRILEQLEKTGGAA
jgi:hypothetical protein